MKAKALAIHWHQDSQPIYSAHFQPALPPGTTPASSRLATAGGDNNVRIWRVDMADPTHPTYLATLSKHTQAVNVVRFDPKGTTLASAGDDGTIILWSLDTSAGSFSGNSSSSSLPSSYTPSSTHAFGAEDSFDDRETWKIQRICRASVSEIYDLAWSPDSNYILAGSMDNIARVYNAATGQCVRELAEHSHYVQGVAWDPFNEYIATQSSDRSVHIYNLKTKDGAFILSGGTGSGASSSTTAPHHKIARADLPVRKIGTGSTSESSNAPLPPPPKFRASASPSPLLSSSTPLSLAPPTPASLSGPADTPTAQSASPDATLTPDPGFTASTSSTSAMNPPPSKSGHSRKSSFGSHPSSTASTPTATVSSTLFPHTSSSTNSSANAPTPPPQHQHVPPHPQSPMSSSSCSSRPSSPSPSFIPLPAVRSIGSPSLGMSMMLSRSSYLYHNETLVSFFRRLTFSPDGSLLLTPSGMFKYSMHDLVDKNTASGNASSANEEVTNTVFIYTRAGLNRPPVAHLPGLKKPSLAVGCSPVFYKLRKPAPGAVPSTPSGKPPVMSFEGAIPAFEDTNSSFQESVTSAPSPAASNPWSLGSPSSKKHSSGTQHGAAGGPSVSDTISAPVFSLKYRMVYAVITQDTVIVYDTEQRQPLCIVSNLNYSAFTDVAWSPDGNILLLTSTDGFCSVVVFENGELGERYTDPITPPPAIVSAFASTPSHGPAKSAIPHHHVPNPSVFQLPIHSPRKRASDPRPPFPSSALLAAASSVAGGAGLGASIAVAGSPQSTATTTNSSRASSRASSPAPSNYSLGLSLPPSSVPTSTSSSNNGGGPVPVVSPMPTIVGHGGVSSSASGGGYSTPPQTPLPSGHAQLAQTSVPAPAPAAPLAPSAPPSNLKRSAAGASSSSSSADAATSSGDAKKKKRRVVPTLVSKIDN